LSAVLLVVGLHQPVAGVVFVLDGVLIGAGDGRYLAWVGLLNLAVFAPIALSVLWWRGGLVELWLAFVAFMVMRMLTLIVRERSDRWLVLGAPDGDPHRGRPQAPVVGTASGSDDLEVDGR
jgi:Na+-driven multidrug efflux pump